MGDQSFARLIRKRRDTLGLTQARLGELVGRSASTIRNWERASSTPSERADVVALAAILGLDETEALEQAGFEAPTVEDRPTVEQAYASLTAETEAVPIPVKDGDAESESASPAVEPAARAGAEPEPATAQVPPAREERPWATPPEADRSPRPVVTPIPPPAEIAPTPARSPVPPPASAPEPSSAPVEGADRRRARRAAPPTVLEAAAPGEPSYVEDPEARQQYRVRALVTATLVIALLVVLLWSFNRATDALGGLWQGLIDSLAL